MLMSLISDQLEKKVISVHDALWACKPQPGHIMRYVEMDCSPANSCV